MRRHFNQQSQLFHFKDGVGGSSDALLSAAVARWNARQKAQHQYTPPQLHLDRAVDLVLADVAGSSSAALTRAPLADVEGRMQVRGSPSGFYQTRHQIGLPSPYESPASVADNKISLHRDTPCHDEAEGEDSPRESLLSNEDYARGPSERDDGQGSVPPTSFGARPAVSPVAETEESYGEPALAARQDHPIGSSGALVATTQTKPPATPHDLLRLAVTEEVMQFTPVANRNYPDILPKSHRQLRWDIQHGQASLHSHSAKITALPAPQVMAERIRQQKERRIVSHAELRRAISSHRVRVEI
jgi:hypothetical protein